jgi:uncharacterized integral membrane protein
MTPNEPGLTYPTGSAEDIQSADTAARELEPDHPPVVVTPDPTSGEIPRTRAGALWWALFGGAVALVVILVFILQNVRSVSVHFFTVEWRVPLAVDLLLAAVLGALIMFTAGSLRIMQLRRVARRAASRPRV